MARERIMVWLPSPMGDAILSGPALRAIRRRFVSADIAFAGETIIREVLAGNPWCDEWIELRRNPLAFAGRLAAGRFDRAILLKNSFGSALTVRLARIRERIGYDREGRGIFLTQRIQPLRDTKGSFAPQSMIDYYLGIAGALGADVSDRRMELFMEPEASKSMLAKLPIAATAGGPLVILVPGGGFGPSKCWPAERYAAVADILAHRYGARVAVSVAPNAMEKRIGEQIVSLAKTKVYSLTETPLTLAELKALFAEADLVIANDTGPRHIAIALKRKVITLFGPNNPAWTQTGYPDEIQLVGQGPCVPCEKPACRESSHFCMESIPVEAVCSAADRMLEGWRR
ncbi:MAG: lipopolysaccharide heptosyltransferase II [Phycisphaerae bacterium]|nr:lipopolysaccharide heptosyltransferase II [Phycisphaerae bacterium]